MGSDANINYIGCWAHTPKESSRVVRLVSYNRSVGLDKSGVYPVFISLFLRVSLSGLILGLRGRGWWTFLLGGVGTLGGVWFWILELVREHNQGGVSGVAKSSFHLGFGLFIVSEVMFFVGFFWRYFCYSVIPGVESGCEWPVTGIAPVRALGIPLLNTVILLRSGLRVTWAHSSIKSESAGDLIVLGGMRGGIAICSSLVLTVALGCYFLTIQLTEYQESSFSMGEGTFGRAFFMLTGLHGLHVCLGCLMLFVCFVRYTSFSKGRIIGLECRIWYWHFVDVVWLFLFGFVYAWGGGIY